MVSFKLKLTLILIAALLGTQANTATDSTDTPSSPPATCTCPVVTCTCSVATCPSSSLPDTTSSTPAPTRCPPGWILWETHCYYISKGQLDEINTFNEAQAMCVQRARPNFTASVASVHSYEENQFIYNEFMSQQYHSDQVFIGLRQYEVLGNYFWVDETPVDYTQWGPLHPYERTSGYQCGQITLNDQEAGFNGEWKNYYCTPPTYYFSGYVCKTQPAQQFPATGTATPDMQPTSLSPNEGCPPAWIGWLSNCYYFSPEEQEDVEHYDHALGKCQAMASAWDANFTAYPASVLNHAENQFIYNELYRRNLMDNAILGLAQEKSGDRQPFYWADGSPVNYTNWIDNAPFFIDDDPACAEMYMKEGKWNDASRNNGGTFKNYVCKGKKISTVY